MIVKEGRREAYLCLIIEGHVSIVKEGAGHEAKQIGSAGVGRIIGEMSLIDGEPRSASVVADVPTTLVVLTGEGFARLSSDERSASGPSRRLGHAMTPCSFKAFTSGRDNPTIFSKT